MNDFPDMDYIKAVCRIGQGANCCRYLTGSARGFECAKFNAGLKRHLDERVAAQTITARGDNCEGRK
jgi:hypothetical protein